MFSSLACCTTCLSGKLFAVAANVNKIIVIVLHAAVDVSMQVSGCRAIQWRLAWPELTSLHQCSRSLGRRRHWCWCRCHSAVQSNGLRRHSWWIARFTAVTRPCPGAGWSWWCTRGCHSRVQSVVEPVTRQWNRCSGQSEDERQRHGHCRCTTRLEPQSQ